MNLFDLALFIRAFEIGVEACFIPNKISLAIGNTGAISEASKVWLILNNSIVKTAPTIHSNLGHFAWAWLKIIKKLPAYKTKFYYKKTFV